MKPPPDMTLPSPSWLPASKVGRTSITPVAWFIYDFDALVAEFAARPSRDREGGGAGPVRFFFLHLGRNRIAEFSCWDHRPGYVELSLLVNDRGVVFWEDYEAVMSSLHVPVQEVHRQGGFNWRRRKPLASLPS